MIPEHHRWFNEARYGLFIHWGPYSALSRGEQVLFREHLDQKEYAEAACRWNPRKYNPEEWADFAVSAGMKYAVLTTRHHDGYCLWDSNLTDYTSACSAPGRDFIKEYVEAFRSRGLKVGLYYSLADWRIPIYWEAVENDPGAWNDFRNYIHGQVEELLTNYGKIDVIWFDGAWPKSAEEWGSLELIEKIRNWQPEILINNRLSHKPFTNPVAMEMPGESDDLGDFGTPEHHITPDPNRLWESCQVSSWRLWGYAKGEQYRSAEQILDFLVQCAAQGGNLLLNVGPDADGVIPDKAASNLLRIGNWLKIHGESVYGTDMGDVSEFITQGYQTRKGKALYLIYRFWPHDHVSRVPGLKTEVTRATLLSTEERLEVEQAEDGVIIKGLPVNRPNDMFPVIRLDCKGTFECLPWAKDRLWNGDPSRMVNWARKRGTTVWTDGKIHQSKVFNGETINPSQS